MVNQDSTHDQITCGNCGVLFSGEETYCPNCGELNPLITPDDLALSPEESSPALSPDDPERIDETSLSTREVPPEEVEELYSLTDDEPLKPKSWWRSLNGCLAVLLFVGFVVSGTVLGFYDGLREQQANRQAEVQRAYEQALEYEADERPELAIAALELALSLDPGYTEARTKLNELKAIATSVPPAVTPIPRQDVAAQRFEAAKASALQGNWEETLNVLDDIRELDPGYAAEEVSELVYTANFELGLRRLTDGNLQGALRAFDEALIERPNDPAVTAEWEKVFLYLSVDTSDPANFDEALSILSRLYTLDPDFADVKARLYETYVAYGDYLASQESWCAAEPRYESAQTLQEEPVLNIKLRQAQEQCAIALAPSPTPTQRAATPIAPRRTSTPVAAAATPTLAAPAGSNEGQIYYARQNPANRLWEIFSVSPAGGNPELILANGTQPAVNRSGTILLYHSERADSLGLHAYNLRTGADVRVTTFAEDVLPRWGNEGQAFIFASQRSGDRRWQVMTAFADGKSEAVVVRDGRTPALALQSNLIAYQGTDPQGNQPGIYVVGQDGGQPQRITTDGSDRYPAFSPTASQMAFMTARNGNWDIWTVSTAGGVATALITSPANDGLPVWSPDGAQLAFVSDRDGSWGIYVFDIATEQIWRVADWGPRTNWLEGQISWSN